MYRKRHVSTQLGSEVGELARQFEWALRESCVKSLAARRNACRYRHRYWPALLFSPQDGLPPPNIAVLLLVLVLVLACVRRLHISARDPAPLPKDGSLDHTVDWEERRNSNEDLLVLYGICKNYEALVVRCCLGRGISTLLDVSDWLSPASLYICTDDANMLW
jgi:hypothetical protein